MQASQYLRQTKEFGIRRRLQALSGEIGQWRQRTEGLTFWERHHSQIHALEIYMGQLVKLAEAKLTQVMKTANQLQFVNEVLAVDLVATEGQRIWQFFREKLAQRWNEDFGAMLRASDTVAWDCYHLVIEQARAIYNVVPEWEYHEPPLVYADVRFSPVTWVRGTAAQEVGADAALRPIEGLAWDPPALPIPLVIIPWDRLRNPWEMLSLPHEVAHDIEQDLGLLPELRSAVTATLSHSARLAVWHRWTREIFADLVAILLAGPAFIGSMIDLLSLPGSMVQVVNDQSVHPAHYIRLHLLATFAYTLEIPEASAAADRYRRAWTALYGDLQQFQDWLNEVPEMIRAVVDTPLDSLGGLSLRQLIPLERVQVRQIEDRAGTLQAGSALANNSLAPRFIPAAARLAFEALVRHGDGATRAQELELLAANTVQSIENNTAAGRRAGRQARDEAIRQRAQRLFEHLVTTGMVDEH